VEGRLKIICKAISLKSGFFSVKQISKETPIDFKNVQIVLDRLFREGILERFNLIPNPGEAAPLRGRPKKRTIYQIKNKKKFEERFAPKLKQNTAADRMWKIIRYRENFTIRNLVVLCGVGKEHARWFVKMLAKAGFISPIGSVGRSVRWGLVRRRDPGPNRPFLGNVISRKKT
jgi:DNA-binding Lrp family transcriptional regulator